MPATTQDRPPFDLPCAPEWAARLAEAVENTCAAKGVVPPPRDGVIHGLAPSMSTDEAKRLIVKRDGVRVLAPIAHRFDGERLFLSYRMHGGAAVFWILNDRTRTEFSANATGAVDAVRELLGARRAVADADRAHLAAREARRRLPSDASAEDRAAATEAVHEAESAYEAAKKALDTARALVRRWPLPDVSTAVVDGGRLRTALVVEPVDLELFVATHHHAREMLRANGATRGYDLTESIASEGQQAKSIAVLQQQQVIDEDGTVGQFWRLVSVTGNNRADSRLEVFGLDSGEMATGVPQPSLLVPGEAAEPAKVIRSLREILKRLSTRLNAEYGTADEDHPARRAEKIASVDVDVVIGVRHPDRLEESLRVLNVPDHLHGQQPYEEDARALAMWSQVIDTYREAGLLLTAIDDLVAGDVVLAGKADETILAAVLTGRAALAALSPMIAPGHDTPADLRDVAVRCVTGLLFPVVPPKPAGVARRDPGRYFPVVRKALNEPAWSTESGEKAKRRTKVWTAAVGQFYGRYSNVLATEGFFDANAVKDGVTLDRRSLSELLEATDRGDDAAWRALVQHSLAPGLVNAAVPLIEPNQGSFTAENRNGKRRAPIKALRSLVAAGQTGSGYEALARGLAVQVLAAPDAGAPAVPLIPDDDKPKWSVGAVMAVGIDGSPIGEVAAKAWYDESFPDVPRKPGEDDGERPTDDDTSEDGAGNVTVATPPEDPRASLDTKRLEVKVAIDGAESAITDLEELLDDLAARVRVTVELRQDLGVEALDGDTLIAQCKQVQEVSVKASGIVESAEKIALAVMNL
jgi:hypothetical protein